MSDNPKKKADATNYNKISSDESKPNEVIIENAEPSSNPSTLSTSGNSSGSANKMKTGRKAVLPGAVVQSVAANNEKPSSSAAHNTLTEFVRDKEDTRGSNYRRRKKSTQRNISAPISPKNKKGPSEILETSLENSEPNDSITSANSSGNDAKTKTGRGIKAHLPGAVAQSSGVSHPAIAKDLRARNYRRRTLISTEVEDLSFDRATMYDDGKTMTPGIISGHDAKTKTSRDLKADLPGAVAQSSDIIPPSITTDFRARNYRRRKLISTEIKDSSSNEAVSYDVAKNLTTVTMPLKNSEPSALPDSIAISHIPNTRDGEQSQFVEGNDEAHDESNNITVESSQDNAEYNTQNNAENDGLVVATLVESDRDIYRTDVIVDAFLVEENTDDKSPKPWYKDRRNLVVVIIIIVAVVLTAAVTSQLSGGDKSGADVEGVFQSAAPSPNDSNTLTRAPTLIPSFMPTYIPSPKPSSSSSTLPTYKPTRTHSLIPSYKPTRTHNSIPSYIPTRTPSLIPSYIPTTTRILIPSYMLTYAPSQNLSSSPAISPTYIPTTTPSLTPSYIPIYAPSLKLSSSPSISPTYIPTRTPSLTPSYMPTYAPSLKMSSSPSALPTYAPSQKMSSSPSISPTYIPTRAPSLIPSYIPTRAPSMLPTFLRTYAPSHKLSPSPSTMPTYMLTRAPTMIPSYKPTRAPTMIPSYMPSNIPNLNPQEVLQLLFDSTNGPSWTNTWDFSSGQSYCMFHGITCDDSGQIAQINLRSNNLRGSLPSEIGMLLSLTHLDLDFNPMTGTIPSEIGMLSALTWLDLEYSRMTGTIPSEIGMLSSLTVLDLQRNLITGMVPSEILMLSSLKEVYLDINSITGTIPSEVGMLSSLERLVLDDNLITGTIPSEIGMLSSLIDLYLRGNLITGTIPSEIGMLSSLQDLYLDRNLITGTIPSEMGMLSSLVQLRLRINSITGMIPTELCALTGTTIFYDGSAISCTCIDSSYIEGTPCN